MDRRTFLATPLVFGLRELFAQEARPAWVEAALRRMKETGRFGVLLVVPDADPLQIRWGAALSDLTRTEVPLAREVLCEAVFICARRAVAGDLVAPGAHNRLLLSPEGKALESDTVAVETLEDAPRFAASFRKLLHGEGGERLCAQVSRLQGTIPEEVRALESDDPAERERASARLFAAADRLLPWLVAQRQSAASPEVRGRIAAVIDRVFLASPVEGFGPRLPYGARIPRFGGGCAGIEIPEGVESIPAVPCGLAAVVSEPRKFLRFLSK